MLALTKKSYLEYDMSFLGGSVKENVINVYA